MSSRTTSSGGSGSFGSGALSRPDEVRVEKVFRERGIPVIRASMGNQDVCIFDPDDLPGFSSEEPDSTQRRRDRRFQAIQRDFGS